MIGTVVDIFSPSWCVSCGKPVSRRESHLCRNCLEKIEAPMEACPVCSGELNQEGLCDFCRSRHLFFDRHRSAGAYDGVMKSLVTAYKFDRKKPIAPVLAGLLFDRCRDIIREADVITPVPLSSRKKWKRGFNQSGVVARMIARRAGIRYAELLLEQGMSRRQKTLGFGERFFNVMGRYAVRSGVSLEHTPSVLIVDDVFTTGATVNECARILRQAGARRVFSVTMARAGIKRLEK